MVYHKIIIIIIMQIIRVYGELSSIDHRDDTEMNAEGDMEGDEVWWYVGTFFTIEELSPLIVSLLSTMCTYLFSEALPVIIHS